jgi:hypothetical protein
MSITKLSLNGNNLIIPGQSLVSDIPAGDGKNDSLILQCISFLRAYRCVWDETLFLKEGDLYYMGGQLYLMFDQKWNRLGTNTLIDPNNTKMRHSSKSLLFELF